MLLGVAALAAGAGLWWSRRARGAPAARVNMTPQLWLLTSGSPDLDRAGGGVGTIHYANVPPGVNARASDIPYYESDREGRSIMP
jgi:hypothetical protein